MARHKKYETSEESDPALDISSLIDVCFLLLIYFIVTSTITPRESDLGMALPAGAPPTGEQPDIEPFYIKVDATGTVYTGVGPAQQPMDSDTSLRDLPLLSSQLEMYNNAARAASSTPLVQIFAEEGSTQQRVIDVLNALATSGINTVTFTDYVK